MVNLPSVSSPLPRDLQQFIRRVREALDGGGPDAVVTARQLIATGLVKGVGGSNGIVAADQAVVETPRAPRNVATAGALASIIVSWASPNYKGHAYAEIWAASRTDAQAAATPPEDPALGQAELVGMTAGNNFSHNIGGGAERWYWVRFINQNGLAGPYNLTDGTFGQTSLAPEYVLEVLTDAVTSSQLATTLLANINTTFSQTSEPTQKADGSALVAGDIWIDTTQDANRMYRYNGDAWIDIQDSGIATAISAASGAQGTADGKVTTYYQTGAPSNAANTLTEGDLWVDTDDGNNLYRWDDDGGTEGTGAWIDIQDTGINAAIGAAAGAQETADGKITSYYQDDPPTNTNGELSDGDLWTDTNDNDATYRWDDDGGENGDGEWVRIGLASFADVTNSITDQVGYCELTIVSGGTTTKSVSTANTTQTLCQAAQADANRPSTHTYAWKSDGAIASELKTVTSSVDGNTATIQENISSIDGLEAQYTVKIDNNGHVAGFGLASELVDGEFVSDFMVAADRFSVVNPSVPNDTITRTRTSPSSTIRIDVDTSGYTHITGDTITISGMGQYNGTYTTLGAGTGYVLVASSSGLPVYDQSNGQDLFQAAYPAAKGAINLTQEAPFVIATGSTQINGVTVPAGTYINSAMIADATIKNAQINDLTADKITASLLNTVDFYGNTIAGSTIYLGGTVTYNTDSGGNNIGIQSVADPAVAMTSTTATFATTAFVINDGTTDHTPFQVVDGVAYLDNAMIKDSTLSFAKVSDNIQSTNYEASGGTETPQGWKLSKNGTFDLTSGTITAGTLQSIDGNFVIDLTNKTISIET